MATPEPPSRGAASTAALVSIAIPVYNTARFLPAALDSLLAQDHPHWGGLLWDDGSTDGSSQILAEYARRDARFRLLGNGRNNGPGIALASALEQLIGDKKMREGMGARSRTRAVEEFSQDRVVAQTLDAYREALARGAGPRL